MLIKYIISGFCVLTFLSGPVAAAEVTARGSVGAAPSSSPVFDPPCDGTIAGSTPARALAEAIVKGGQQDYVGAAEVILKIPAVRKNLPKGAQDLFGVRRLDVGQCQRLCVVIPEGSEIITYRFVARNAGSGNPGPDWFKTGIDWISCGSAEHDCSSVPASMFKTPDISLEGGPKVVCSVFKNWSDTYGREGSFTVEYR